VRFPGNKAKGWSQDTETGGGGTKNGREKGAAEEQKRSVGPQQGKQGVERAKQDDSEEGGGHRATMKLLDVRRRLLAESDREEEDAIKEPTTQNDEDTTATKHATAIEKRRRALTKSDDEADDLAESDREEVSGEGASDDEEERIDDSDWFNGSLDEEQSVGHGLSQRQSNSQPDTACVINEQRDSHDVGTYVFSMPFGSPVICLSVQRGLEDKHDFMTYKRCEKQGYTTNKWEQELAKKGSVIVPSINMGTAQRCR